MKKPILLILVAIFMIGLDSCKKESDNEGSTTYSIIGTWTRLYLGETLTIIINANNTYSPTLGSQSLPSGNYSISGSNFTIIDQACNFNGNYTYSLAANVLTINLVADTCDGRYQTVPGTYNRK